MTNEQLKGARRAQNRYPEVAFRTAALGVEVNGVLVPITANMTADQVFAALAAQAVANG